MLSLENQQRYTLPKSIDFTKVRIFLNSKAKRSWRTANTYRNQLVRFQKFLNSFYPQYNVETVLDPILKGEIDRYRILDELASFWTYQITPNSVHLTINAVKSYLQFYDIELNSHKFKNKVTLPGNRKEDERPLDKVEIRRILLATTSMRLRAYLFLLAVTGCRAVEGLAVRLKDLDFTIRPTKVYFRAEYSKNKLPREVYLTDEATEVIRSYITMKGIEEPNALIFAARSQDPDALYTDMNRDFMEILKRIGMDQRKEGGAQKRHEITLHSFRRFVKTLVEDLTTHSFSEYILGHKKSVYYTKKEPERRELWREKCSKELTYLDYTSLERREKGLEGRLEQKDQQIRTLELQMQAMQKALDQIKREILLISNEQTT